MATYTPYSSAVPFFQDAAEPGIPELDQHRLGSYALYEQFYWNHPQTFKLVQRGDDESPIYLPSSRKIVEATNRFLALDFDYVVDATMGTPDGRTQADLAFRDLFRRENFHVKFTAQKRFGLIRGDAIWHITADDTKPEGTRISIHDVNPKRYFPITDPDNVTRVIGCHLIETIPDPRDDTKQVIRRQTYRKGGSKREGDFITSELSLWTVGKWDDRSLKPEDLERVQILRPESALPPAITQIPVYHIRNTWDENNFGSSLLRGIETIIAAANQGVSDQALSMAIMGLGYYWTDAAPPVDAAGQPTAWEIGPLRMTEVPQGSKVGKLDGVGSVTPSIEHLQFLLGQDGAQGIGIPDIAAGKVDVSVAESGISLRLQLAPILASNAEREQVMLSVYDQMFFDLRTMWFPTYESANYDADITSIVGDPLPQNREAQIKEIIDLKAGGILSIEEARKKLIELGGYEIEASADALLAETTAAAAAADPFGQRVDQELNSGSQGQPEGPPSGKVPAKGTPA